MDGEPFSPAGLVYTPDHFARATLAQVRRYLSLLPRSERFSEGYIGQQVESGAFRAALEAPARAAGCDVSSAEATR